MSFFVGPSTVFPEASRRAATSVTVRLGELRMTNKFDTSDRGFLDVHTTEPRAPAFVARVAFSQLPCEVTVSTLPSFECLVFHAFVYCTNAEGREVSNRCGTACATRGERIVALVNYDGTPAVGTLSFVPGVEPSATEAYPQSREVRELSAAVVDRSKAWWDASFRDALPHGALQPLNDELNAVHVPTLACPFPHLPGCFFAFQTPAAAESEELFELLLRAAARRRALDVSAPERLDKRDACLLVAEALAALPNCMVYNADTKLASKRRLDRGKLVNIEAFCADPRTVQCGDCDDMAREILNVAHSLRRLTARTPLVRVAQRALSYYAVTEQLAAVALDPNPANRQYSTGSMFAHAFAMLLPLAWMQRALRGAKLKEAPPGEAPAGVLTQDGISLFDPDALRPTNASLGRDAVGPLPKTRAIDAVGLDFYKFPVTCLLLDELVVSDGGVPVRELRYETDGFYGARYADVLAMAPGVTLRPAVTLTAEEDAAGRRCAKYFHPIVPLRASAAQPAGVAEAMAALGATPTEECRDFVDTFFIQGMDVTLALAKTLRSKLSGHRLLYRVDSFGSSLDMDFFTLQVYVCAASAQVGSSCVRSYCAA